MKKKNLEILQFIAWGLGFIALGLLVYAIIRALMM
jgi:hypothetical protein